MDSKDINRLLKAILIRGEQLANVEGANETAQLLQSTASLLSYFTDERSWGSVGDELHAMQDYGSILRSCFGRSLRIECALPADQFIRRRVLLNELLDICTLDRILMNENGKIIEIQILLQENRDDYVLCTICASFEGDESGAGISRNCKC